MSSSKPGTPLSHGKGNEVAAPAPNLSDTSFFVLAKVQRTGAFGIRLSPTGVLQGSRGPSQENSRRPACASSIMGSNHQDIVSFGLLFWKAVCQRPLPHPPPLLC